MESKKRVVIIGGGPVGVVLVHVLHMAPPGAFDVKLIRSEPSLVNRCAIPYGIPDDKKLEDWIVPDAFVSGFGCDLVVDTVVSVDRTAKTVSTEGGKTFWYDVLVLGLGAKPIVPPLAGVKADNVVTVRRTEDMIRLKKYANRAKKATVIGGGYIGLEIASSLVDMGVEVTIVEMLPHVLLMTCEEEFASLVEKKILETPKVTLKTGVAAKEFVLSPSTSLAEKVVLSNGESIETDIVVLSVGIRPELDLAKAMGLAVSPFGVVVDSHMRTSDPSIYCGGDMVEKKSMLTGKPTRGEFGTTAVFQAKVIGMTLLGMPAEFPGVLNANASVAFGYAVGSAGLTEKEAVANGFAPLIGSSQVLDKYPMMAGRQTIRTKLIFDSKTMKLIGGSVLEPNSQAAAHANWISLAIGKGATLMDVMTYQYSTHPELASRPSEDAFVMAAMDAWKKAMAMSQPH